MDTTVLRKLGGLSLIAGGILLAIYAVLFNVLLPVEHMESDFSLVASSPYWVPVCAVALVAMPLLIFGWIAAYSKIHGSAGIVGLLGFLTLTIAYVLQAGQLVLETFFYPAIASTEGGIELFRQDILINHPMAMLFIVLFLVFIASGVLLTGITVIRSKTFSTASGILFMTGAVLYAASPVFLLSVAGILLFAAGCVLIGLRIRKDTEVGVTGL